MPQRTEQRSGCAEGATGGEEVGTDTGEGESWKVAVFHCIQADLLQRSMPKRQPRKHVYARSRRSYETETSTAFGNVRGASGVVGVVGVVGEVQTMIAGHLATPDLRHLDVETLQTGAATAAHRQGG